MSERKLFFPGLGGNRYEISLEELQKQAYKGKIKRDDKIIVAKIKDGITTEIETTCGKIKVAAESFDQGEADRKAEAERKLAERKARDAERFAQAQVREAEHLERKKRKELAKTKYTQSSNEPLFEPVRHAVKKFVRTVMTITIASAVIFCLYKGYKACRVAYVEAHQLAHKEARKHDRAYAEAYYESFSKAYDKAVADVFGNIYDEIYYNELDYSEVEITEKYKSKLRLRETTDEEIEKIAEEAIEEGTHKDNDYDKSKDADAIKAADAALVDYLEELFGNSDSLGDLLENADDNDLGSKLVHVHDMATNKAREIGLMTAREIGQRAGEKASKVVGPTSGMAAGIKSFLRVFLHYAIRLGVLAFCVFLLIKNYIAIPLVLSRYQTETIKLAIMNTLENGSFQHSETPINPTDGSAPRPIDVPPRINP